MHHIEVRPYVPGITVTTYQRVHAHLAGVEPSGEAELKGERLGLRLQRSLPPLARQARPGLAAVTSLPGVERGRAGRY